MTALFGHKPTGAELIGGVATNWMKDKKAPAPAPAAPVMDAPTSPHVTRQGRYLARMRAKGGGGYHSAAISTLLGGGMR